MTSLRDLTRMRDRWARMNVEAVVNEGVSLSVFELRCAKSDIAHLCRVIERMEEARRCYQLGELAK